MGSLRPDRPVLAAIALGSNLGDRRATIDAALDRLRQLAFGHALRLSAIRQTAPVGPVAQGPFLNAAALLATTLPPRQLLEALLAIERDLGRDRAGTPRWGPRTLDLDLLLFGSTVLAEPDLTIPHPRLHERAFVLDPLAEIAGEWPVPTFGRTVAQLRRALADAHGASA